MTQNNSASVLSLQKYWTDEQKSDLNYKYHSLHI